MRADRFLETVAERVLIGDGAMGTYLHERGLPWDATFEALNLTTPDIVLEVHRAYIQAGAELILTNTFAANVNRLARAGLQERVREINRRGAELARRAAGDEVLVAGSVGPLGRTGPPLEEVPLDRYAAFREQIEGLLEGGADVLVLETFDDLEELRTAAAAARDVAEVPLVCQMAFGDRGHTLTGVDAAAALEALTQLGADVAGGNCGSGPLGLVRVMERLAPVAKLPLSAFPNASIPQYEAGRQLFAADADYIADCAERLADLGVALIGGCCGTTPEHIAAIAPRLKGRRRAQPPPPPPVPTVQVRAPQAPPRPPSALLDAPSGHRTIIVEVDPPRGLDHAKQLAGASALAAAGADAVSVADNPLASVRMSAFMMGHAIQQEVGLHAVVHLACRDHNLIGQQSLLLGASALGISSILAVTGDPVSGGPASSVFDLNSITLVELMTKLNAGVNMSGHDIGGATAFTIGVAFNPNVRDLEKAKSRLRRKMEAGAHFAMTQPVYEPGRVAQVAAVSREAGLPIFLGLMPLVSTRNAEFLHSEVPGIRIPDDSRQRMREADPRIAAQVGLDMAKELADAVLDTDLGVYIITPLERFDLAADLVRHIRARAKPGT
ncbi:MAG: bifunctional homocysteine S-methyltransferase/methylenetetrahydrofolate reductase [Armatimonadota bacterium]